MIPGGAARGPGQVRDAVRLSIGGRRLILVVLLVTAAIATMANVGLSQDESAALPALLVEPALHPGPTPDTAAISVRLASHVTSNDPLQLESRHDGQAWVEVGLLTVDEPVDVTIPLETTVELRARAAEERASSGDAGPSLASDPIWATVDSDGRVEVQQPPTGTLLIAGDIAGCDWSGDSRTADIVASRDGVVMTAGDNAYQVATRSVLQACYGPTWGRFKSRTRPVLGNHDDFGAFFDYFGRKAGPRGRGWYALDLGAWRIYALDSNCEVRGQCRPGSRQYRWLRKDLEEHARRCTMAVLHHPTFSSGPHRNSIKPMPLVTLLYRAGNDLVVNGHDHIYERFQRARPWGKVDLEHGMRQFIVGTGGAPLYALRKDGPRHSQVSINRTHGVLRLTLSHDRYAWRFLPVGGRRFEDRGETVCHDPPPRRGS